MINLDLRKIAPILLAAGAAGCAAGAASHGQLKVGGSRPAWVESESSEWPRSGYVLGVGSADDENTAAERSRGEVARVFSADISVLSSVSESESMANDKRSFSQTVSENVRSATRKVLEGVDVVARWKDSTANRYYALAVLPRAKALEAVDEKMTSLDKDLAQWKAVLDQSSDKFIRAKAAAKVSALLKARLELENDRRVLGGGTLPSGIDAAAAKAAAFRALAALDVVVDAQGDGADETATGIVSGLTASGLTAKRGSGSAGADLLAEARTRVEPVSSTDPRWKFMRATATITLQEAAGGKAFARFETSAREASGDSGEARRRALVELAKKAAEQVSAAISDYFVNQ